MKKLDFWKLFGFPTVSHGFTKKILKNPKCLKSEKKTPKTFFKMPKINASI